MSEDSRGDLTCSVPNCGEPYRLKKARLCWRHYHERRRRDAGMVPRRDPTVRDEQGRKQCRACREWKPEVNFSGDLSCRDNLDAACKECQKIKNRRRKDRRRALAERLLAVQKRCCRICGRNIGDGGLPFGVDHDHDCCRNNQYCELCVRGLLCYACNSGLGHFQDNPLLLLTAFFYLVGDDEGRVIANEFGLGYSLESGSDPYQLNNLSQEEKNGDQAVAC